MPLAKLGTATLAAIALLGALVLNQQTMAQPQAPVAPPNVTATSVFVMNADTGQVLYEKNPDKVFRILSLTKLVTAFVLVDRMGDRLSETVTVAPQHLTGGSTAGLKRGDVWTLQDLLYGMVLVSGNDASLAIADHVGRDLLARENKAGDARKRFVEEMRTTAKELGAEKAGFADPYGLAPANAATARDMGVIAARVFTDPRLLPAWACTKRTLRVDGPKARTVDLETSLEILGEGGVLGAKTGSHFSNGIFNLVTAWRAPNAQTIVGVVLGSTSDAARYNEMRAIMAAVPRDFPGLAEGPADAGAAGAAPDARR
jgi:serine-type D-Ala-D-Ala carboxypeptidase (penicillin-binding protein 5/6)